MARWARMLGWAVIACSAAAARAQLRGVAQLGPGRETVSLAALTGVQTVLRQFSEEAGVIFAGEVVAIRQGQSDGEGFASGVVEVDFRVDEAVRGCEPGTYTLREWGGLWGAAEEQRYRVGQRALVFLHAPGASGLSSPVEGLDGVVPMVGSGVAPGPLDTTTATGMTVLDLRWLATHAAQRTTAVQPVQPILRETSLTDAAGGDVSAASGAIGQEDAVAGSTPMMASTAAALALLHGWEAERRAAQ